MCKAKRGFVVLFVFLGLTVVGMQGGRCQDSATDQTDSADNSYAESGSDEGYSRADNVPDEAAAEKMEEFTTVDNGTMNENATVDTADYDPAVDVPAETEDNGEN